ncbi:MAG: diacylglycerol kinase family protein [Gammaproteobacteria bacterium]|jgi:diacylglycerol kinase (ATP)|nr:diacylglycerol kinase family protein [Gammaproteobacteria bacterium]
METQSLAASFGHALAGIRRLLATQRNARIHLLVTTGVAALGWWLSLRRLDWALLVVAMGLVWIAEAMNSALEALGDTVDRSHNPGIAAAKDLAAGAVLLAAVAATLIGALVLFPYLA